MIVGASALSTAPVASAVPDDSSPDQHEADLVATSLSEQLARNSSWGGVVVDGTTVRVRLTSSPAPELERTLRSANSEAVPVTFDVVKYTAEELDGVIEEITADSEWFAEQGIEPTMWGVDPRENAVYLEVASLSPEVSMLLSERYGAAVKVSEGVRASVVSRSDDASPWTGGAAIRVNQSDGAVLKCSSGFQAVDKTTGYNYNITAGHCLIGPGEDVDDGGGDHFGTEVNARFSANTWDGGFIHTLQGSDDVWRTNVSKRDVTGSSTSDNPGVAICYSGAVSQEGCQSMIWLLNVCVPYSGYSFSTCGLVASYQKKVSPGDSGGPVYTTTGATQAWAVGIASGFGKIQGFDVSFNTPIRKITSAWNLKVRCGSC
jgi:hypothetical protein